MRTLLILLFIISSSNLFADLGNGYRFHLHLVSKNSDTISGYFYHYTYDDFNKYEDYDKRFKEFIKKDSISLYTYITTVNAGNINIDFTLDDYKKEINLNDFSKVRISECLTFDGGVYKLRVLKESQFNLIKNKKPNSKIKNAYALTEYCHLVFYNWDKPLKAELLNETYRKLELKKEELGNNLEGNNAPIFYNYFNQLQLELLNKNILLIMYCESC